MIKTLLLIISIVILYVIYLKISNILHIRKLLFMHIPKTAGSYIEEVCKDAGIFLGKYDNRLKLNLQKKCNFWHLPPKYNKNINFKKFITFAVLRDPIDRLISEYNYQKGKNKMKFSLNEYVDSLVKLNQYEYDCHLLPQSEFLTDYYGNEVQNIIRFDYLKQDLKYFFDKYGYTITIPNEKMNESNKTVSRDDLSIESELKIREYYKNDYVKLKEITKKRHPL